MIMALDRRRSRNLELRLFDFRSGGTWDIQALRRS
jgi:hypothetical protein